MDKLCDQVQQSARIQSIEWAITNFSLLERECRFPVSVQHHLVPALVAFRGGFGYTITSDDCDYNDRTGLARLCKTFSNQLRMLTGVEPRIVAEGDRCTFYYN
jgi:hypothetical protein